MLWLFVIIGLVTLSSALYGLLNAWNLSRQIRTGMATAGMIRTYLGFDSVDELDGLRAEHPKLLRVLPSPPGPYESIQFSFEPAKLARHRRQTTAMTLQSVPVRAASLALLAAAMLVSHEHVAGWLLMLLALSVEVLCWLVARRELARQIFTSDHTEVGEPVEETEFAEAAQPVIRSNRATSELFAAESTRAVVPVREEEPIPPAAKIEREAPPVKDEPPAEVFRGAGQTHGQELRGRQRLTTCLLLSAPWRPVRDVLLASLRRCGLREASPLDSASGEGLLYRIGAVDLSVQVFAQPVAEDLRLQAAAHSWDWPSAEADTRPHGSYIRVTSWGQDPVDPAQLIRLHHQVHVAAAEFAPALAALWPEACRLVPASTLADQMRLSALNALIESCVTFRTFGAEGHETVWDTLGLTAFELPDVELRSPGLTAERAATILRHAARVLLSRGPGVGIGELVGGAVPQQWQLESARSRFEPERRILRLGPRAQSDQETPSPP